MNTSKYMHENCHATRKTIKQFQRTDFYKKQQRQRAEERQALENTLSQRNQEIAELKKALGIVKASNHSFHEIDYEKLGIL